ncbi:hypothetical protein BESB_073830 [Besnoitia besnoiti]|uniref:Uncharacterized protein n=1 Tax=Besnoitia besnoiti TaxID=94643 RepID=A0A2A9MD60_BESBE|nr:uncharacterized protein BESB_073830 [Besnoitia besnoiti]PFH34231.1 hypothetical protein BESB_073830 [Besnoitia besnoiti]
MFRMAGALSPVDQLQLPSCTEHDFQEALAAIKTQDAIMDEGIFEELKRYSSFKYLCHKRQQQEGRHEARQEAQRETVSASPSSPSPPSSGDRGSRRQSLTGARERGGPGLQRGPSVVLDISTPEDFACIRKINHEACNLLANSYEGYAWMCQVAAELLETLEVSAHPGGAPGASREDGEPFAAENYESRDGDARGAQRDARATRNAAGQSLLDAPRRGREPGGGGGEGEGMAVSVLLHALCDFLTMKYDSIVTRKNLLDDRSTHGSWNPPAFYWQLFKHPSIICCLVKLYQERPQDEFLACWFQDFTHHYRRAASTRASLLSPSLLASFDDGARSLLSGQEILGPDALFALEHFHTQQQLSKLTSNFSVYTLRMSEEIRRFLLWDESEELYSVSLSHTLSLFLHAENAFFYALALLVFIASWRPDLRGCRRLAQLLTRAVMAEPRQTPASSFSSSEIEEREGEREGQGEEKRRDAPRERLCKLQRLKEERNGLQILLQEIKQRTHRELAAGPEGAAAFATASFSPAVPPAAEIDAETTPARERADAQTESDWKLLKQQIEIEERLRVIEKETEDLEMHTLAVDEDMLEEEERAQDDEKTRPSLGFNVSSGGGVHRQREISAAQLYLLMTNLNQYPQLDDLFRSVTRSIFVGADIRLSPYDACELCDLLHRCMAPFESMKTLLYERQDESAVSSFFSDNLAREGGAEVGRRGSDAEWEELPCEAGAMAWKRARARDDSASVASKRQRTEALGAQELSRGGGVDGWRVGGRGKSAYAASAMLPGGETDAYLDEEAQSHTSSSVLSRSPSSPSTSSPSAVSSVLSDSNSSSVVSSALPSALSSSSLSASTLSPGAPPGAPPPSPVAVTRVSAGGAPPFAPPRGRGKGSLPPCGVAPSGGKPGACGYDGAGSAAAVRSDCSVASDSSQASSGSELSAASRRPASSSVVSAGEDGERGSAVSSSLPSSRSASPSAISRASSQRQPAWAARQRAFSGGLGKGKIFGAAPPAAAQDAERRVATGRKEGEREEGDATAAGAYAAADAFHARREGQGVRVGWSDTAGNGGGEGECGAGDVSRAAAPAWGTREDVPAASAGYEVYVHPSARHAEGGGTQARLCVGGEEWNEEASEAESNFPLGRELDEGSQVDIHPRMTAESEADFSQVGSGAAFSGAEQALPASDPVVFGRGKGKTFFEESALSPPRVLFGEQGDDVGEDEAQDSEGTSSLREDASESQAFYGRGKHAAAPARGYVELGETRFEAEQAARRADVLDLPSASQYGTCRPRDFEYQRLRKSPAAPPLEALRETALIDSLIEDFVNAVVSLETSSSLASDSGGREDAACSISSLRAAPEEGRVEEAGEEASRRGGALAPSAAATGVGHLKYVNLLVMLCVLCAYELTHRWWQARKETRRRRRELAARLEEGPDGAAASRDAWQFYDDEEDEGAAEDDEDFEDDEEEEEEEDFEADPVRDSPGETPGLRVEAESEVSAYEHAQQVASPPDSHELLWGVRTAGRGQGDGEAFAREKAERRSAGEVRRSSDGESPGRAFQRGPSEVKKVKDEREEGDSSARWGMEDLFEEPEHHPPGTSFRTPAAVYRHRNAEELCQPTPLAPQAARPAAAAAAPPSVSPFAWQARSDGKPFEPCAAPGSRKLAADPSAATPFTASGGRGKGKGPLLPKTEPLSPTDEEDQDDSADDDFSSSSESSESSSSSLSSSSAGASSLSPPRPASAARTSAHPLLAPESQASPRLQSPVSPLENSARLLHGAAPASRDARGTAPRPSPPPRVSLPSSSSSSASAEASSSALPPPATVAPDARGEAQAAAAGAPTLQPEASSAPEKRAQSAVPTSRVEPRDASSVVSAARRKRRRVAGGGERAAGAAESETHPSAAAQGDAEGASEVGSQVKSTVTSKIYRNVHTRGRLGRGRHLSQSSAEMIRNKFNEFKGSVERYKAIARSELVQIYRVCRNPKFSFEFKLFRFFSLASTSLAASAILKFIDLSLFPGRSSSLFTPLALIGSSRGAGGPEFATADAAAEGRPSVGSDLAPGADELAVFGAAGSQGSLEDEEERGGFDALVLVSDGLLLLLKLIVDRHAAKRLPVMDLLGRALISGARKEPKSSALAQQHMERRMAVVRFLLYLCKFENQVVAVISLFCRLRVRLDRSLWRFFLSELLRHCGPPFSSSFCLPVLQLLLHTLQTQGHWLQSSTKDPDARRLRTLIGRFVEESASFCDAPREPSAEVVHMCQLLERKLQAVDRMSPRE